MSKKSILASILSFLLLFGLMGCASLSSFQEARTLEKGKGRMILGLTQYSADSSKFKDPHGTTLVFDIGLRLGILEKMDLGLRYTLPGTITGDVKYMFTGRESKMAFSSGLKIGYMNADTDLEDTSGTKVGEIKTPTIIDVSVPLNISFYPVEWLAFTVSPDATYRTVINGYLTAGPILGLNGNLKLGKNWGILAEGGWHKPLEDGSPTFVTFSGVLFFPYSLTFMDLFK